MKSISLQLVFAAVVAPALLLVSMQAQQSQKDAPPVSQGQRTTGETSARIFGIGPKFVVVEAENPRPLGAGDKFRLFAADATRPYQFAMAGAVTGLSMINHDNRGFGQGGEGFGKRFGAAMADEVSGNFFGTFLFPTIFRQDPRYFRQGTGSTGNRLGYAVSRLVVTRSDSGKAQFNASRILGTFCTSGLSNAYYPESERTVGQTFATIGTSLATTAGLNVLKEFWPHKKK